MMDENRRPRFRFRLVTLLFVVAILALLLVAVMQQVQINRQRAKIEQMNRQIARFAGEKDKLTEIIRVLRDAVDRAGSSSDGRHR
jgi:cytochrome c-type biogenesis protein CcmH/NrfG